MTSIECIQVIAKRFTPGDLFGYANSADGYIGNPHYYIYFTDIFPTAIRVFPNTLSARPAMYKSFSQTLLPSWA